jgi:hypothetical protein
MRAASKRAALEEFGHAKLGDARRTCRLVLVAGEAFERGGTVAAVFKSKRGLEGAYDFLENPLVDADAITASSVQATLNRIESLPYVVVPVDGTSLQVVDRKGSCDFGRIGSDNHGARGLKLVDALAVQPNGAAAGWLALTFWARPDVDPSRAAKSEYELRKRPVEEKETQHWITSIKGARAALDERAVRGWFQIDREGDSHDLLSALRDTEHWWTVRGNVDRTIQLEGKNVGTLRSELASSATAFEYSLDVPARPKRRARRARMVVRVGSVRLRMRDRSTGRITRLPVNVVWAREEGATPAGEDPIDWLLYTNHDVESVNDARLVIQSYSYRWRVEECHRTWKRGRCNVEATQLRSYAAVKRWAIIQIVNAARIERLKYVSRTTPDAPASIELSEFEIRALIGLKYENKPFEGTLTIGQAVSILAEFGGWANKYSGKPPGAVVIGRGLEYLEPAARLLETQARSRAR